MKRWEWETQKLQESKKAITRREEMEKTSSCLSWDNGVMREEL